MAGYQQRPKPIKAGRQQKIFLNKKIKINTKNIIQLLLHHHSTDHKELARYNTVISPSFISRPSCVYFYCFHLSVSFLANKRFINRAKLHGANIVHARCIARHGNTKHNLMIAHCSLIRAQVSVSLATVLADVDQRSSAVMHRSNIADEASVGLRASECSRVQRCR